MGTLDTWELTDDEKNKLPEHYRQKYEKAVQYKKHDWAGGPWGGWARGNDILMEMGWKEVKRVDGHRQFITLVKPILK